MAAVVLLSAFMKALTKLMVASCTSPVLAFIVACRKFVIASITWVKKAYTSFLSKVTGDLIEWRGITDHDENRTDIVVVIDVSLDASSAGVHTHTDAQSVHCEVAHNLNV